MPSKAASRTLTAVTLIASAACFAFICVHLSAHRMMWADEFDAWNLLADPSWRHALQSLNNGADSGPPLFYAIGRCILAVTGLHPVAVRLYSAFCFWLAAVVWVQILRRYFTGILAVAAVVLAFLCNPEIVDQIAQVRFYGELVLAATLAVGIALWLEEKCPSAKVWFVSSALGGLLLVAAHPLGLIYSAAIVFAQMFSTAHVRKRVAALAGTVLSWTALLIFFLPVMHAAETDTWLSMPNVWAVVHWYDNHPLMLWNARYFTVLLNLCLLGLAVYACLVFIRRLRSHDIYSASLQLLLFIAALFLLMPIGFAIVSHLYKPLFLTRYLLPYFLGLSCLVAAGAWLLAHRVIARSPRRFAAALAVPLAVLAVLTFREEALRPVSELDPILQLAQSMATMPIVIQNDGIVRQAHFYAPGQANNLFYVMLTPRPGEHATLDSIAQQGYEPYLVFDKPFFSQHRQFLFLEGVGWPKFYDEDLRGNSQWSSEKVATVTLHGTTFPVLRFTRVDDAPTRSR